MPTAAERYNFANVEWDGKNFITETFKLCKVYEMNSITTENLTKIGTKDVLAKCLANALKLIDRQHNFVINQRVHISGYQQDIIKLQSDVISAQKKALEVTSMITDAIEVAERVTETVEETVKSGIRSYSEALGNSGSSPRAEISPATLKSLAKQVLVEEELSKNLIVFGLPEQDNENVCDSVMKVMEELSEKPRLEADRLGKKKEGQIRPVKVTFTSAAAVQQILAKSRNLRRTEKFKEVFLSPDRTLEQRAEHRELVAQLKKKAEEEPQRYHFIKKGQICSTDKSDSKTQISPVS